jgi:AmiR/NasT family two-component response regulator
MAQVAPSPAEVIVHQASGIIMARRGTTIDEAVMHLYELAEAEDRTVTQVAADLVNAAAGRHERSP